MHSLCSRRTHASQTVQWNCAITLGTRQNWRQAGDLHKTYKKKKKKKSLRVCTWIGKGEKKGTVREGSLWVGRGLCMHVESRIIFCEIISLFGFGAIKLMWTDSNGMTLFLQLCLRWSFYWFSFYCCKIVFGDHCNLQEMKPF